MNEPNVPRLTSRLLSEVEGVRHAFFTRVGGVSHGLYRSLNCAFGSQDDATSVAQNRTIISEQLSTDVRKICAPRQAHTNQALLIDSPYEQPPPIADATVTQNAGLAAAVLTADCAPVLFACPRPLSVAATHAGWKGALAGVAERTVEHFKTLGADPRAIRVCIGPCIQQSSYEVGPEFRAEFVKRDRKNERHFLPAGDKYNFDLPGYIEERLRAAGVMRVERLDYDTCSDPLRFFSYRRATRLGEFDYGRQLSAIVITSD